MNQAESLYYLQDIELNITRRRRHLQEIAAQLSNSEAVASAQAQVNTTQKTLAPLQVKVRDLELETQSTVQKARAAEQNLYSGLVKNPKEMQDIQQEIAALNRRHGDLENQVLETMLAAEEAETAWKEAKAVLENVTAALQEDQRQLLDEQATLETEVRQLLERRKGILTEITPENLKLYQEMKPRKGGQPISVLKESSCTTCGVDQTMAIEREARVGQNFVYCANCGRILVYRD